MIETSRLLIKPLDYSQVEKHLKADHSLECVLNLGEVKTNSDDMKEVIELMILPSIKEKDENHLFSTLWIAIMKKDNVMVGDLCFKGPPNDQGEVEIGYGTYQRSQNKGFMSEMVGGMIAWANSESNVSSIIASTSKSNVASFKVLEKNNVKKAGETDAEFNWKIPV